MEQAFKHICFEFAKSLRWCSIARKPDHIHGKGVKQHAHKKTAARNVLNVRFQAHSRLRSRPLAHDRNSPGSIEAICLARSATWLSTTSTGWSNRPVHGYVSSQPLRLSWLSLLSVRSFRRPLTIVTQMPIMSRFLATLTASARSC